MMINKDGALTVGHLRAAIAGLADDVAVGQGVLDLNGFVSKITSARLVREHGILVLDHHPHAGCFSDDEDMSRDLDTLATA